MTCRYTRVKIDYLISECPDRPSLLLETKVGLIYIWNQSLCGMNDTKCPMAGTYVV